MGRIVTLNYAQKNSVEHTNSRTSSRSAQFMICVACSLTRKPLILFMMQIPKCRNLVLIQHPFQQTQENVDSRKKYHTFAARTPDNKFIIISHTAHTTRTTGLKLCMDSSPSVPTQSCRRRLNGCGDIILYTFFSGFHCSREGRFQQHNSVVLTTLEVKNNFNTFFPFFHPPFLCCSLFSIIRMVKNVEAKQRESKTGRRIRVNISSTTKLFISSAHTTISTLFFSALIEPRTSL